MILSLFLLIATASVASAYYKGSMSVDGFEYMYYAGGEDNIDFCAAQFTCTRKNPSHFGTRSAMPKTENSNDAIVTLLAKYGSPITWVGANDIAGDGYWTWNDGTPITYDGWDVNQPNYNDDYGEDCLAYYDNGKWHDFPCSPRYGYLCEISTAKAVSSDFSELTIYEPEEKGTRSFSEAKIQCEKIGARLVKIPDERSKEAVMEKISRKSASLNKYWIDVEDSGSRCSILSQDGPEEHDCEEEGFGFICETARPNMLKVSDEHPVITESGDVEIDCSVSGYPVPDVAWYKDDELVHGQSVGVASSTLLIKNASTDDGGKYVCVASNTVNGTTYKTLGISRLSVTLRED